MKQTSLLFIFLMMLFQSCLKDTLETTYTYRLARPVYSTSAQVRSAIGNKPAVPVSAPGKMYLMDHYIFLNEINKGIHIIDNSNPSNPRNEAFIAIPGCMDMAVTGTTLYADCFTDLMVLDIANPKNVQLKHFVPNLFPDRKYILGYSMENDQVITDWVVKDTTVTYKIDFTFPGWFNGGIVFESDMAFQNFAFSNSMSQSGTRGSGGKGGSMARFAISHNHLYAVTNTQLMTLSLQKPQEPQYKGAFTLPWGVETVYPFKDKLFIGANSGMHIFSLNNPENPQKTGTFTHARVCDPVIADDQYAYVTLRSGTVCTGFLNQLDVVDVTNIYNPVLVKSYPLTHPGGLDKNGDWLFVCDGKDGLRVLDARNVGNITIKKSIAIKDPYDIICRNNIAIVSAAEGLFQYDISDINNIRKLSFIGLN